MRLAAVVDTRRHCALLIVSMAILLLAGCRPDVTFRMTSPQVSPDNRYIGLDVELGFDFHEDWFSVVIANTGQGEVLLDWEQATFVGPDGIAVQLVSAGPQLIRTLPEGSRTVVKLTLVSFTHPRPPLWHRRSDRQRHLVHPLVVKRCAPSVRVALPTTRFTGEAVTSELLQFTFDVRLGGKPAVAGEKKGNGQDWDF